jgi:hypothetical protein
MLRRRIGDFLASIQVAPQQHELLIRSILLYALGRRNAADLRQLGRQLGIADPLYDLKSTFLDRSYYVVSLWWRVVFRYFRRVGRRQHYETIDRQSLDTVLAGLKGVSRAVVRECEQDLRLLDAYLSDQDKRFLVRVALTIGGDEQLDVAPIVDELQRFCHHLAYRKLRFLANNDTGVTLDDLRVEVFEAALATLLHYDAEPNRLKLINTAKRGARNHCMRLIDWHTAQRRTRLLRVGGEYARYARRACGTCAWYDSRDDAGVTCQDRGVTPALPACRLDDQVYHARVVTHQQVCGNCRHYDVGDGGHAACLDLNIGPGDQTCPRFEARSHEVEFVPTTQSLDRKFGDDARDRSLNDVLPAPDEPDVQVLTQLTDEVDGATARVVGIIAGMPDQEFDTWVWDRIGRSADDIGEVQTARLACEFVGVSLADVRRTLASTNALSGKLRRHVKAG